MLSTYHIKDLFKFLPPRTSSSTDTLADTYTYHIHVCTHTFAQTQQTNLFTRDCFFECLEIQQISYVILCLQLLLFWCYCCSYKKVQELQQHRQLLTFLSKRRQKSSRSRSVCRYSLKQEQNNN